jgi:hypothetical protein
MYKVANYTRCELPVSFTEITNCSLVPLATWKYYLQYLEKINQQI